jgi:LPS O-antigen subunit length determinant protein (WzzB/FepE family)
MIRPMHENLNPHPDAADIPEIDLLDLLVVAAENARLLILIPLIMGLLALAGAYAWPKTYESVSVLSTDDVNPAVVGSWATSGDLLAPVLKELGLFMDKSREDAVRLAREIVIVTVGKQDKLVTLTTSGETPESARQLNQRVLDQLVQFSRPAGPQKTALQFQLDTEKASLVAAVALEKELGKRLVADKLVTEAQSRVFSDLLRAKTALLTNVAQLQLRLEGLSASNVVQAPSLPERPVKPKKVLVAVAAALSAAVALLVFVFARQALRNADSDPATAGKLQRIRRGLGLRG